MKKIFALLALLLLAGSAQAQQAIDAYTSGVLVNVNDKTCLGLGHGESTAIFKLSNLGSATVAIEVGSDRPYSGLTVIPAKNINTLTSVTALTVAGTYRVEVSGFSVVCAVQTVGSSQAVTIFAESSTATTPSIANQPLPVSGSLTVTCANSATTVNGSWVSGFSAFKNIVWYISLLQSTGGTTNLYLQHQDTSLAVPIDRWSLSQAAAGTGAFNYTAAISTTGALNQTSLGTTAGTFSGVLTTGNVNLSAPWGDQFRISCVTGSGTTLGHAQTMYYIAYP